MSNGTRQIQLKPVHDELEKLIGELRKIDPALLAGLGVPSSNARRKTLDAWIAALQNAKEALEEWCPDGARTFMISVNPRQR